VPRFCFEARRTGIRAIVGCALLVFRGETPAVAEGFARADPYVRHGCVTRWKVRPWTVVIGG